MAHALEASFAAYQTPKPGVLRLDGTPGPGTEMFAFRGSSDAEVTSHDDCLPMLQRSPCACAIIANTALSVKALSLFHELWNLMAYARSAVT